MHDPSLEERANLVVLAQSVEGNDEMLEQNLLEHLNFGLLCIDHSLLVLVLLGRGVHDEAAFAGRRELLALGFAATKEREEKSAQPLEKCSKAKANEEEEEERHDRDGDGGVKAEMPELEGVVVVGAGRSRRSGDGAKGELEVNCELHECEMQIGVGVDRVVVSFVGGDDLDRHWTLR